MTLFCHLLSFMDHLLNNNLRRSPHFGKCPSPRTRLRFLTFLACFTVLICESLLSLNTAEWLFLAMSKNRKEKKERKKKKKREKSGKSGSKKYLLLTEFEVCTVSYRPSFFPLQFMAQARSARAINRRGKNVNP